MATSRNCNGRRFDYAAAREAPSGGPIRVRIGIHTGEPQLTDEGYVEPSA